MAVSIAGTFVSVLNTIKSSTAWGLNLRHSQPCTFMVIRNYAARKGTREKAKKKKVQKIVEKKVWIPHNKRNIDMSIIPLEKVRFDDVLNKDPPPNDDVWIGRYHALKVYSLPEAIQCHKETHSLGMLDHPDAYIKALIELEMAGPKISKNVKKFSRLSFCPHAFTTNETRTVLAFCKTPELQEEAKKAGATLVGGPELITRIQHGEILPGDYDFVVAHPDIMADIILIKGLLRRKFPTAVQGSLTGNIGRAVHKFLHGIRYSGHPHERQPLYGLCEITFGRLNMETEHLEENFAAVINDLNVLKPKKDAPFIWRVIITTELRKEFLKINHRKYLQVADNENDDDDVEDDDDEPTAVAV